MERLHEDLPSRASGRGERRAGRDAGGLAAVLISLQRTVGNHAVQRYLARRGDESTEPATADQTKDPVLDTTEATFAADADDMLARWDEADVSGQALSRVEVHVQREGGGATEFVVPIASRSTAVADLLAAFARHRSEDAALETDLEPEPPPAEL